MNAKKLKDELAKYKRQYKVITVRNADLENQFQMQEEKIAMLTDSLKQCQNAVDMNKQMLRQAVAEHSRKEQELITAMNRYKERLKELGHNGSLD